MKYVDLRSEENQRNEDRAKYPLDNNDEKIAAELAKLSLKLQELNDNSSSYRKACKRIRKIGESLCSNGGSNRMDLICYRVYFLIGTSHYCRINWDGICGWYY